MSTQQLVAPVHRITYGQPVLSLNLFSDGPDVLIRMSGEIDLGTAHLLTELIAHVTRQCPERVVLDMARVSFFCADGLRALIHARDTITAAGGQLLLRDPSVTTRRVLALTGTGHLFQASPSVTAPNPVRSVVPGRERMGTTRPIRSSAR
jgi:anti-anti-sigma factor